MSSPQLSPPHLQKVKLALKAPRHKDLEALAVREANCPRRAPARRVPRAHPHLELASSLGFCLALRSAFDPTDLMQLFLEISEFTE